MGGGRSLFGMWLLPSPHHQRRWLDSGLVATGYRIGELFVYHALLQSSYFTDSSLDGMLARHQFSHAAMAMPVLACLLACLLALLATKHRCNTCS
eukprot:7493083-Heterocapsa_arctica.AAC.1